MSDKIGTLERHLEAIELQLTEARREIADQRSQRDARCRAAAQALIEDVGADGPMSLEQAVARTRARLTDLEAKVVQQEKRCDNAVDRLCRVVGWEGEGSEPPTLEQMVTLTLKLLEEMEVKVEQQEKRLARYREVIGALGSELRHIDHEEGVDVGVSAGE